MVRRELLVHPGREVDTVGDKPAGIAVHTEARIAAAAKAGEILVSSTVCHLVAGSGIQFQSRGAHLQGSTVRQLTPRYPRSKHQFMLTSVESDVIGTRALSDPLRAEIVELLTAEQLCTCHIVEATGAKQTNISNHLRILRDAGLVRAEPCGRFTYYQLVPERLEALAANLGQLASRARLAVEIRRPCS